MGKHALSVVVVLLSIVAAQGHSFSGRYLRESGSSFSTDSSGHTTVNAGDTRPDFSAVEPRDASFDSISSHDVDIIEAAPTSSLSTGIEGSPSPSTLGPGRDTTSSVAIVSALTRSPFPQIFSPFNSDDTIPSMATPAPVNTLPFTPTRFSDNSAATISISQETYVADEIRNSLSKAAQTVAPSNLIPEPATVQITAPAPVYAFSSPSIASSSPIPSPRPSQDQDIASYSTGTVTSTEERAAVESTALELSTSVQQLGDASSTASAITGSDHSTASTSDTKATSTTSTTSTTDQTNGQDRRPDQRGTDGPSSTEPPTSNSALRSPILYACVVLAVAGLVGAVFAFRANRNCDERRVVTEALTATPSPLHRAAWAPPVSQVRDVIDDHNFAML